MPSDGREDERFKDDPAPKLEPDDADIAKLAIDTEDPTGARRAFTTINNSNIEKLLADTRKLLPRPEDKQEFKEYAMYNIDLWLLTYEKEISDENGEAPAFTNTVTNKPAGAEVQGAAQEFEGGVAPEAEEGGLDIPELGAGGVDEFEGELEEILMMERYNVGK